MNILSPSILSADFTRLGQQISACTMAGAQYIHIDVMDGLFVPSISYGLPVIKSIRSCTDAVFDVHLMINDPIRYIDEFASIGSDIITFHQEATPDPGAVIDRIHRNGKKAAMAIKPHTTLDVLEPFLDNLDMILVMSVEPGFGGQIYKESSTEKIRNVRQMLDKRGLYNVDIEVDGGVNLNNLSMILDAGANVIVAGSAIFKGSIDINTRAFLAEM
ncbi:ribulose-phosphate 3-epimerase [Butyrivibrio sp. NC3005]|uniref:ribulose-phosphate 3-epimerase n=1 Tax=Butyrivibrio sp. NC3005 TaxID=1280685 RepID=UPI000418E496|nr:ribulose-phosphate 3-epimerase [Butyrivibrio sp. NC3005]